MNSALYFGSVRHRRFTPRAHQFSYGLFMACLDLAELDTVFAGRLLWSARRSAVARFCREDHLGDPSVPLDAAVRSLVQKQTGFLPTGPIRLLTNLRYFGYVINPISIYYCLDASGERIEHAVLEVTNTPWGERHCYVLSPAKAAGARLEADFEKALHVSPFLTMDYTYRAHLTAPGAALTVHLENLGTEGRAFDATLTLRRKPIDGWSLAFALIAYPFMTAKTAAAIHFEALRLWVKGVPYIPRPHGAQQESPEVPNA